MMWKELKDKLFAQYRTAIDNNANANNFLSNQSYLETRGRLEATSRSLEILETLLMKSYPHIAEICEVKGWNVDQLSIEDIMNITVSAMDGAFNPDIYEDILVRKTKETIHENLPVQTPSVTRGKAEPINGVTSEPDKGTHRRGYRGDQA